MQNPFKSLRRREWALWGASLIPVLLSNVLCGFINWKKREKKQGVSKTPPPALP